MKNLIAVVACIYLSACASIVSGTQQSLFVETPMVDGATCKLNDSKNGTWYLASTPGSATVAKGNGPMNVVCEKTGYVTGVTTVEEELAGAMWANTIIWWGYIVDAATGAAQKYPDKVVVWLKPREWKSPDEEATWNAEKRKFEEAEAKAKAEKETRKSPPPPDPI
jgi:hypothetical protein